MDERTPVVILSPSEMVFIASSLGAEMLMGMPDPFTGWLVEEIEAALEQAKISLADRQIIEIGQENNIVVDAAVALLVAACAFPAVSFTLSYFNNKGQSYTGQVYVSGDLIVEQINQLEKENKIMLLTHDDIPSFYQWLLKLFQLAEQKKPDVPMGSLPGEALNNARSLVEQSSREAAAQSLESSGLNAATAVELAETLHNPVANGVIAATARDDSSWEIAGFGILEGENGLWRLRSFDRDNVHWVEVIPCDSEQAAIRIAGLIRKFLPGSLKAEKAAKEH